MRQQHDSGGGEDGWGVELLGGGVARGPREWAHLWSGAARAAGRALAHP